MELGLGQPVPAGDVRLCALDGVAPRLPSPSLPALVMGPDSPSEWTS